MTTRNDINGQEEKLTVLYGRLSDDGVDLESNSITN